MTVYDNRRVTDEGFAHLKGLPRLDHLDLRDTRMTNGGLKHLAAMNRLELRLPQMTDRGLQNIPRLLTKLAGRVIGGSQVTDAGLVHLAGLQHLENLRLNELRISDEGLKQLQGLKNLGVLNLSRTPISDAGLIHLRGLSNVNVLELHETQVTAAGVAELQVALPNCTIRFSDTNELQVSAMPLCFLCAFSRLCGALAFVGKEAGTTETRKSTEISHGRFRAPAIR